MTVARWNMIPSLAILGGALAWLTKFGTILASDGKETVSGTPALLYDVGLLLLAGGVVGIALRLTRYRPLIARLAASLLAPLAFFSTFLALDFLVKPLIPKNWPIYVEDEAAIAATATLWLVIGLALVLNRRNEERSP